MQRIESILNYWFGQLGNDARFNEDRMHLWFGSGRTYDGEIKKRFGTDYGEAIEGKLDDWAAAPRGRLALIVLLDQFSRHIHRNTPQAFAQDERAQVLSLTGITDGLDRRLHPIERFFFYLPLEHAEDLALQRRSVEVCEELLSSLPGKYQELYRGFLDYAVRHMKIIERFGRFPDLNQILGRQSTPEELEFLSQPGSSFL